MGTLRSMHSPPIIFPTTSSNNSLPPVSQSLALPPTPTPALQSAYPQTETYFITLCTHKRECLFGDIVEGEMQLNDLGLLVAEEWQKSFDHCANINLHHWVIMPNHIHGIIAAADKAVEELPQQPPVEPTNVRSHSLLNWITTFKRMATQRINHLRALPHQPLWQQEVDQHVISHRFAFHTFHQYITTNPHAWDWDKLHPDSPALS